SLRALDSQRRATGAWNHGKVDFRKVNHGCLTIGLIRTRRTASLTQHVRRQRRFALDSAVDLSWRHNADSRLFNRGDGGAKWPKTRSVSAMAPPMSSSWAAGP